jgi:hypothetical protein
MTRCRPLVVVACALVACAPRPQTTATTTTTTLSSADYAARNVVVKFNSANIKRDYQYISGEIKNTGPAIVTYWKVWVRFLDAQDNVIDTDYESARGPLGPGQTIRWELMHRYDKRVHRFLFDVQEVELENGGG